MMIVRRARPLAPSPACGGGLGRGQAHSDLTPSLTLPRKREREHSRRAFLTRANTPSFAG